MAEKCPPLPVQTLPPLLDQLSTSGSTSLTCIPTLSLCPSIIQVAFLDYLDPHFHSHTLSSQTSHSPSSQYVQTISTNFFSSIPPLHNSLHLRDFTCHTFHTRSHHPTLSLQMPLSGNLFPQHAPLSAGSYSMSTF